MKANRFIKELPIKLGQVYLPFLIVGISAIGIYTGFRWLIDIKYNVLNLKDDLWNFWFAGLFSWGFVMYFFRPYLRILSFPKHKETLFWYQMIAVLAVIAPTVITQTYIEKACFSLQQIETISDVENLENEKYFKVANFKIIKEEAAVEVLSRVVGSRSGKLKFVIYFVMPFENGDKKYWFGKNYTTRISNKESDEEKQKAYSKFIKESQDKFEAEGFTQIGYFEKLRASDHLDGYFGALEKKISNIERANHTILIQNTEPFDDLLGNQFNWIFYSLGIGAFIFLILILFRKVSKKGLKDFKANKPIKDDTTDFIDLIFSLKNYPASAFLITANCLIFIYIVLMGTNVVNPTAIKLFDYGGLTHTAFFEKGEYWRMFTYMFLHAGIEHLFMNIIGLALAMALGAEQKNNSLQFLLIYLLCGIGAAFTSLYFGGDAVRVGASGAILGLYGFLIAQSIFDKNGMLILMLFLSGINIVSGFIFGADNAAHIGGFISGFIIGVLICQMRE